MNKQTYSFGPEAGVPPQVGPFAHATRWGNLLFVTGQMPTEPSTGLLIAGGLAEQANQVKDNLEAVLAQFGATLDDSVMVRVYLEDFGGFDEFNALYQTWFHGPLPSRTCVGSSGLAAGAALEIDLIVGLRETEQA
jgi:reactive intermediate/imine deaminase